MSASYESSSYWTCKYQPTHLSMLVGHARTVRELREWMRTFGPQSTPIVFLHGSSGIGKTSLATLLFTQFRYHIFEMNAGEIRSKKRIKELLDKILSNNSVSIMKRRSRQRVIALLFDEVDGLSCGDRGGLHQLFAMVGEQYEKGQVINPVICISNRPYDKKIPSYLYREIALSKPTKSDIFKHLRHILELEKKRCEDIALQLIIQHGGGDVRKCINFLQEVTLYYPNEEIQVEMVQKVQEFTYKKNNDYNIFDATRAIFKTRRPFNEVNQLFSVDSNLLPMMIFENLPHQLKHKKISIKQITPEYLFLMHNLALSDTLTDVIMRSSRFELAYSVSMMSCGYVNERMTSIPSKVGSGPNTVFTNTLTKSATQSNTHSFISSLSYKLNVPSMYCIQMIPTLIQQFIADATNLLFYNIDQNDLEKMLQIYQKWTSHKINTKQKKSWKHILQTRSLPKIVIGET